MHDPFLEVIVCLSQLDWRICWAVYSIIFLDNQITSTYNTLLKVCNLHQQFRVCALCSIPPDRHYLPAIWSVSDCDYCDFYFWFTGLYCVFLASTFIRDYKGRLFRDCKWPIRTLYSLRWSSGSNTNYNGDSDWKQSFIIVYIVIPVGINSFEVWIIDS